MPIPMLTSMCCAPVACRRLQQQPLVARQAARAPVPPRPLPPPSSPAAHLKRATTACWAQPSQVVAWLLLAAGLLSLPLKLLLPLPCGCCCAAAAVVGALLTAARAAD